MAWRVHRTVCDLGVLCSSSGSVSCGVTSWGHSWSPFVVHRGWPEDLYAYELPRLLAALNFFYSCSYSACLRYDPHPLIWNLSMNKRSGGEGPEVHAETDQRKATRHSVSAMIFCILTRRRRPSRQAPSR